MAKTMLRNVVEYEFFFLFLEGRTYLYVPINKIWYNY